MDGERGDPCCWCFMFRDQGAALQQEYANKNAFNRVRPPKFGPAPAAPMGRTRQQDFTGRDLAFGLAKAGFDAVGAGLAKAPDMPFQDAPPLPEVDYTRGITPGNFNMFDAAAFGSAPWTTQVPAFTFHLTYGTISKI